MVGLMKANVGLLHAHKHEAWEDAKQEILEAVGDISGLTVAGSQVLLGVYLRPSIKKLGTGGRELILPGDYVNEDQFQGKVSLVLKFGESALPAEDDPHRATFLRNWGGRLPEPGEWVFSDVKSAFLLSLAGPGAKIREDRKKGGDWTVIGWPARLVYMKDIYGRVEDPSVIV